MRRTKISVLALTGAASLAITALAAAPADAESATFTLTAGSLSVAEPSSAALTGATLAAAAGGLISGALGSTVVTDARGGTTGWTSSITGTTAFSNGTTSIAVTNVKAWVPGAVTTTGVVVATSGTYLTQLTGLALTSSAQALVTASAVVGNNTATFTPSISVAIPADATAGAYTGAVTQTVS